MQLTRTLQVLENDCLYQITFFGEIVNEKELNF